jgi:large subunit ribosomal protein L9
MMEVILLERVEKLGQMGQVVKVRPGFARNYLLPQKKALRATKENLAIFEQQRAQLEAKNLSRRGDAEQVAAKLNGITVIVIRQAGESGQLYGSVTARDVAQAVTAAGFSVAKGQVTLDKAIKTLGLYPTKVRLHPEVSVQVTVNVAQSAEEAEMQAKGVRPARAGEEAAPAAQAPAEAKEPKPRREKKAKAEAKDEAPAKGEVPAEKPAKAKRVKAETKPAAKDADKAAKPKSEKREKKAKTKE